MNPDHRPFVAGAGPLPTLRTEGLSRNYSIAGNILLAAGAVFVLGALVSKSYPWIYVGAGFFVFAGLSYAIANTYTKTKQKWDDLAARGIVLDAELIKASASTDESVTLICRYRFTNPQGTVVTGRSHSNLNENEFQEPPAPGTPMLVMYIDDETFEAL
jgi:hypothetical protein